MSYQTNVIQYLYVCDWFLVKRSEFPDPLFVHSQVGLTANQEHRYTRAEMMHFWVPLTTYPAKYGSKYKLIKIIILQNQSSYMCNYIHTGLLGAAHVTVNHWTGDFYIRYAGLHLL